MKTTINSWLAIFVIALSSVPALAQEVRRDANGEFGPDSAIQELMDVTEDGTQIVVKVYFNKISVERGDHEAKAERTERFKEIRKRIKSDAQRYGWGSNVKVRRKEFGQMVITIYQEGITYLLNDPDVLWFQRYDIVPDDETGPNQAAPHTTQQELLTILKQANLVAAGADGDGMTLVIVDTGVTPADLPPGVVYDAENSACFSFKANGDPANGCSGLRSKVYGGGPATPEGEPVDSTAGWDCSSIGLAVEGCGHGTAMAEMAHYGAPKIKIISIRIGHYNQGPPWERRYNQHEYEAAFNYIIDMQNLTGEDAIQIDAVNFSFGNQAPYDPNPVVSGTVTSACESVIGDEAETIRNNGAPVFTSAGNQGHIGGVERNFACDPNFIAVAASDEDGNLASDSNYHDGMVDYITFGGDYENPFQLAHAPGIWQSEILVTETSGTSNSSALAAGIFLALKSDPDYQDAPIDKILEVMKKGGTAVPTTSHNNFTGWATAVFIANQLGLIPSLTEENLGCTPQNDPNYIVTMYTDPGFTLDVVEWETEIQWGGIGPWSFWQSVSGSSLPVHECSVGVRVRAKTHFGYSAYDQDGFVADHQCDHGGPPQ